MTSRTIASLLFSAALQMGACSESSSPPAGPHQYISGEIRITNHGEIAIRITNFVQSRGDLRHQSLLNVTVYASQSYFLRNILDGGDSRIFPGGDMISVTFVALAPDPSNPDQPLFENQADLTVNGNAVILIKSDGDYSIGPE